MMKRLVETHCSYGEFLSYDYEGDAEGLEKTERGCRQRRVATYSRGFLSLEVY